MNHFDWYDFFKLANELSERDDEASIRSAISRYYYSAFCSARQYLIEIKSEVRFEDWRGIHTEVYRHLKSSKDDNEAELGELLESLFESRKCADYDWKNTDITYFKNELGVVQEKVNLAFEDINALKENPSDFRF